MAVRALRAHAEQWVKEGSRAMRGNGRGGGTSDNVAWRRRCEDALGALPVFPTVVIFGGARPTIPTIIFFRKVISYSARVQYLHACAESLTMLLMIVTQSVVDGRQLTVNSKW